ncbi:nuclear transport factor 2 family protein [Xanthomonas sp. D-109]|uniref:nuclear transport factor 2 family protein n=1 Tax=Xanthomonas sp. D-109 TaxID=2821274 RepID=UPI001ADA24E7|nr:nuclear transport factor 2 family protein [Xanthomonas sp. D-109]MBO9883271.1 nuclear transport factor 2 family protein [Xanthomonas sp. D-109]
MKRIAAFSLLFFATAFVASAKQPAQAEDQGAIHAVVESFRTAIIERDKPKFLSLFVKPDLPWQSVLTDRSLAKVRNESPKAIKARFKTENNPTAFIDEIANSPTSSEETFSNVKIDSDGDVATVSFDYTFIADGKATNSGRECWLLVRTESGWKITTLAYSVELAAD